MKLQSTPQTEPMRVAEKESAATAGNVSTGAFTEATIFCERPLRRRLSPSIAADLVLFGDLIVWYGGLAWLPVLFGVLNHPAWAGLALLTLACVAFERLRGLHSLDREPEVSDSIVSILFAGVAGLAAQLLQNNLRMESVVDGVAIVAIAMVPVGLYRLFGIILGAALRGDGCLVTHQVAVVGLPSALRDQLVADLESRSLHRLVAILDSDSIQPLETLLKNDFLDEVVLVAEGEQSGLQAVVDRLELYPVTVAMIGPRPFGKVAGTRSLPLLSSRAMLQINRQRGWANLARRALEIALASVSLTLLSPLLLLVALVIRLESPGPALFKQSRFGYGGRPFMMLKFRSMHHEAADASGSRLTSRNDDRVTRFGAFLRRTSIDELPQIINVLRGDLALVGPRPHPPGAKAGGILYDELIPNYKSRYRVRPGLTGLAQCLGLRGNTETTQQLLDRFEKDMEYVERWSPWLDVQIMAKTVQHMLTSKNAF